MRKAVRSIVVGSPNSAVKRITGLRADGLESEPVLSTPEVQIQKPDFLVENHNSIFLLRPLSDAARNWVDEHIGQDNGYQPYFPTVVIDHSYISDIVLGIQNDGLVCL
jgi:hypothetical protein